MTTLKAYFKRATKAADESMDAADAKKPCKYGPGCYRKNAAHLRDFSHHADAMAADKPPPTKRTKVVTADVVDDAIEQPTIADATPTPTASSNPVARPPSTATGDKRQSIAELTGFAMPDDFYALWDVCRALNDAKPTGALAALNVTLCGPYRVLDGEFDGVDDDVLLLDRRTNDMIECQTIVECRDADGRPLWHLAYWRDRDGELPTFVCKVDDITANFSKYAQCGDNVVAALLQNWESIEAADPTFAALAKTALETSLKTATLSAVLVTDAMKKRASKAVVAPTLHKMGIVVPMLRDVGYRPLPETNQTLRKWLHAMGASEEQAVRDAKAEKVDEIITYIQFANDEGDYGMGLELAHDMMHANYASMDGTIGHLLTVAYRLLRQTVFERIATKWMPRRHANEST